MEPLYISTGKVADGEDRYFPRKQIEQKIWRKIKQGENLLLAAPRRTGKSSILKFIEKHPEPNYLIKYKSVQSIDSTNEFFKHLYILLLEDDLVFAHYKRYLNKAANTLKKFISRIRGISLEGVEISPDEKIDYHHEFCTLLGMLPEDMGTLVFLIDEFPDAVKNIAGESEKQGIHFLQLNRDLRLGSANPKFQFVYTGSIGLGNVVNKLGRLDLINDIINITVSPLSFEEGRLFIQRLALGLQKRGDNLILGENIIEYILAKDSWRIPYYIQIIVDELCEEAQDTDLPVDEKAVDRTIFRIIQDRYAYQDYFENWKTRLKQALEIDEYRFAIQALNQISTHGSMDFNQLHDLAVSLGIDDVKAVINILEYDGYISRDKGEYRFNSIILKEWWYINVAA